MSQLPRPGDWEEPVALPAAPRPQTVVIPFDGSHTAERALSWGILVAKNNGAEVVVVVAFDPPLTVRGRGAAYVEEMKAALHEEALGLAEEAVALLEAQGVTARGVVIRGDIARGILEIAEDEGADMIIIGRQGVTHEMGGALDKFRSLMSGGIADKISRHATIPVLMVV